MIIIGRIDKADFPELSLTNIEIKIDTGAYTSTIHAHHIKEVIEDGKKYLEFELLDPDHIKYRNKNYKVKNYQTKKVKSSFGDTEQRFIINTNILIFNKEYPIELSLSERSDMKFPILIGRKFLKRRFMVNTSLKNVSFKLKLESKKKK